MHVSIPEDKHDEEADPVQQDFIYIYKPTTFYHQN